VITTSALTRRFGATTALAGVTLEVPRGEMFALIGPDGAGKTTFFRLVAGVLAPTSGTVTRATGTAPAGADGSRVTGRRPRAARRAGRGSGTRGPPCDAALAPPGGGAARRPAAAAAHTPPLRRGASLCGATSARGAAAAAGRGSRGAATPRAIAARSSADTRACLRSRTARGLIPAGRIARAPQLPIAPPHGMYNYAMWWRSPWLA